MRAETANWRLQTYERLRPNVEIQTVVTPKPLQHARSEQVRLFLASKCTRLFILDGDCVPKDRTIQRLLAHNLPLVAAPHRANLGGQIVTMVLDRVGYKPHRPLVGLQGPDVLVGCAGMLIHRSVFEKLGPPWFRCTYDEWGMLIDTEDFDLCNRWHAVGGEVWADCDLMQKHVVERVI
jgi:hypothetical protein